MTERLYYDDAYLREFEASVVRLEPRDDRHVVWLDRSLFYPTTGGQPFDTGVLGSARVVDVFEEDDDIVHLVEGGSLSAGQRVTGRIDWLRRFDHMQQHTGQHVLSAAFVRIGGATTISFHLGADISTIDLSREMSAAQITDAENEANRVVWDDRAVTIRYASAEDAAALPLRKTPSRVGTLRLIDIEACDLSACGGTHVGRTGAVGVIAVAGWERFKGGLRVSFVCGGRALGRFRQMRETATASVRLLSVLPDEIPVGIERMLGELREQKRSLGALQTELAHYQAEELAGAAERHDSGGLVLAAVDGDANSLKALASATAARGALLVVLVSKTTPAIVVAARSSDQTISCDGLIKSIAAAFGGRGGGRPDLAQAGGLSGPSSAILESARAFLRGR